MKESRTHCLGKTCGFFVLASCLAISIQAAPLGTSFTYQGQLKQGGSPATGTADFEFRLFDAQELGNPVGPIEPLEDVVFNSGLFTVDLDFGADVFTGDALWLEISAREGTNTGAFTVLTPRQSLTATPNSHFAEYANTLDGHDSSEFVLASGGVVSGDLTVTGQVAASTFELNGEAITSWPASDSLWSGTPGSDISYDSGNVGVGTASPGAAALSVQGYFSRKLTGTVTVGPSSSTVIGVGTLFTTELAVGDSVLIKGEVFDVANIASDTDLTLDDDHMMGALGVMIFTGDDLFHARRASGELTLVIDRNGNLIVPGFIMANRTIDECPSGFTAVTDEYCIQTNQGGSGNWFTAVAACTNMNAHLCSWAEWYGACQKAGLDPPLLNMIDNWEYVDDGGGVDVFNAMVAVRVGNSNCSSSAVSLVGAARNFRCCVSR